MSRRSRRNRSKPGAGTPRHEPLAPNPSGSAALIILAKAPLPGQVKTRLCPPLTPDEAATLHGSFVLDVLERSRDAQRRARVPFDRYVWCSPSADHVYFKILGARHGVGLDTQRGDDLGARMLDAFETLFARGHGRVVMVGTDLPTLPPRRVNEAVERLEDHDVVLGPATDGGYYLIGLRRVVPALFRDIPWSTPNVLARTRSLAAEQRLRVALLAPERDIDRLGDLQALIEACASGAGDRHVTKRTGGVLHTLAQRLRTRQQPER